MAGASSEELPASTANSCRTGRFSWNARGPRERPAEGTCGTPGNKVAQRPQGWKGLGCADGDTALHTQASARVSGAQGTPSPGCQHPERPHTGPHPKSLLRPRQQIRCNPEARGPVPHPAGVPPTPQFARAQGPPTRSPCVRRTQRPARQTPGLGSSAFHHGQTLLLRGSGQPRAGRAQAQAGRKAGTCWARDGAPCSAGASVGSTPGSRGRPRLLLRMSWLSNPLPASPFLLEFLCNRERLEAGLPSPHWDCRGWPHVRLLPDRARI